MLQLENDALWYEAYLDTPLIVPQDRVAEAHRRRDPNVLRDVAGVCVKSRERDPVRGGFPARTGKLVLHDASRDYVVVRGYGDAVSPRFVWAGTVAEYDAAWEVD